MSPYSSRHVVSSVANFSCDLGRSATRLSLTAGRSRCCERRAHCGTFTGTKVKGAFRGVPSGTRQAEAGHKHYKEKSQLNRRRVLRAAWPLGSMGRRPPILLVSGLESGIEQTSRATVFVDGHEDELRACHSSGERPGGQPSSETI